MPYLMSWIFSFLGGVQMTIKRIHIRYEDDFFNHHRPFSLGFTLDRLNFGNAGSHWTFQTPNGMLFTRTENNYTNKEFDIIKMRIYVNTMSEMFISTSLWEATQD
jgi:hypothetical protein